MSIKRLTYSSFRNLAPTTILFESEESSTRYKDIFISGKNGQGKTSLLEAIFIISHVRSFRSSSLKDVISLKKQDHALSSNSFAYVSAIVETELGEVELEVSIQGKKRELLKNKKKIQSLESFCGQLKSVLFTPEDLEIIKGAPQIRRQFLDRILVMNNPRDITLLNEYTKKVKFRNASLKAGDVKGSKIFLDDIIDLNIKIIEKRRALIEELRKKVVSFYSKIAGDTKENFDLVYNSSFLDKEEVLGAEQIKKMFESIESKETAMGRTLLGNHKDELKIEFQKDGVRSQSKIISSQGQMRTKILSFKLASAEIIKEKTGYWPVLLLDDVEAELDQERRHNLRKIVMDYSGQVFLTGTEFINNDNNTSKTLHVSLEDGILSYHN